MTNDPKLSCAGELTAEILMAIMSIFTVFLSLTAVDLYPISRTTARTRSAQDENLFLSAAYALFLPLMSYLFSQAKKYDQELRAPIILIWMVYVEIIRIGGGQIFTWELKSSAEQLVRLFWVGFLVYNYSPFYDIWACLFTLCIFFGAYEIMKGIIFHLAGDSYLIGKNPEVIDSHMKKVMLQDHLKTTPMSSCDYIVMGEENQEVILCNNGYLSDSKGIITIGRVFGLSSREDEAFTSQHPYWRDTCLSFALAKMLRRRFAKLSLQEAGSTKALDFVLKGLVEFVGSSQNMQTGGNNGEKDPVERLFGIIQEELKFVSEFLCNKVPIYTYFEKYILVDVIGFCIVSGFGAYLPFVVATAGSFNLQPLEPQDVSNHCFLQNSRNGYALIKITSALDLLITQILQIACIYIHLRGFIIVSQSNVKHIRKYFKDPTKWYNSHTSWKTSILAKLLSALANYKSKVFPIAQEKKYWRHIGGVHSCALDMKPETIFFCIKVDLSTLVSLPKWISKNIRTIPPVFHSTDAKEAVLRSFTNSGGQLTNGETSLRNHGMEYLNWAFQTNGSNTEAILVWHIATTLFEHHEFLSEQNSNPHQEPPIQQNTDFLKERTVAVELSNYCYYLVAQFPELLPDHVEWAKVKYESMIKEILAMDVSFNKKPTGKDRCNYALQAQWVESSVADDGTSSIIKKGAKLVEDLIKCAKNGTPVWKVLAEFWAEMMLFIAPSDNVEGHTKILHRRELITQLWALLTHAGILTRSKATEHHDHDHVRENKERTGDVNV